ncbi:hypothetical protein GCM10010533_44930 [Mycolicibacterium pallens]
MVTELIVADRPAAEQSDVAAGAGAGVGSGVGSATADGIDTTALAAAVASTARTARRTNIAFLPSRRTAVRLRSH